MKAIVLIFAICFTLVLGIPPEYRKCLMKYMVYDEIPPNSPPGPKYNDVQRSCAQACYWEYQNIWYSNGTMNQEMLLKDKSPFESQILFSEIYNACINQEDNCARMYCMLKKFVELKKKRKTST